MEVYCKGVLETLTVFCFYTSLDVAHGFTGTVSLQVKMACYVGTE